MPIKSTEEVILTFVQWTASKDGTNVEVSLQSLNDEPRVREAFAKFVELSREGVRDAALDETIDICNEVARGIVVNAEAIRILGVVKRIRALKGGG